MVPTVLAMLVGLGVSYYLGRKLAERYPSWVGLAVSLGLACAAGLLALLILAFVAGFVVESAKNLFDVQPDPDAWFKGLVRAIWGVFVGAAVGAFHGRRRAAALRSAEAEAARMKEVG